MQRVSKQKFLFYVQNISSFSCSFHLKHSYLCVFESKQVQKLKKSSSFQTNRDRRAPLAKFSLRIISGSNSPLNTSLSPITAKYIVIN